MLMILLKNLNEKMKKVLFFMFLLFLCLGTASVKAQVRIGGNTAPNGGAMLDLNATDATNNGTKGLALPRVNLTTNTMQLTTGVANLTGMLVYNTTATLGAIGIYYWNGANWVLASLPSTSAADSGKFLMSNGTNFVAASTAYVGSGYVDTTTLLVTQPAVSWTKIYEHVTVLKRDIKPYTYAGIAVPGMQSNDLCVPAYYDFDFNAWAFPSMIIIQPVGGGTLRTGWMLTIRCYRPSV